MRARGGGDEDRGGEGFEGGQDLGDVGVEGEGLAESGIGRWGFSSASDYRWSGNVYETNLKYGATSQRT